MVYIDYISRVPDQNGVYRLYIIVEIDHSGRKHSINVCVCVRVGVRVCVCVCVDR